MFDVRMFCKDCEEEIRPEDGEEILDCPFCGSTDIEEEDDD